MPKFLQHYFHGLHRKIMVLLSIIFLGILFWYSRGWGVTGFVVLGISMYMAYRKEQMFKFELQHYITTLKHQVKKVGTDVVSQLPVGILIYDEEENIRWHNPFFLKLIEADESAVGKQIATILPPLADWLAEKETEGTIRHGERVFQLTLEAQERVVYLLERTDFHRLQVQYRQGQLVFAFIHLDNLEEVTQGLDEQRQTLLVTDVTHTLSAWAQKSGIYLKRTAADKFFGVLDEQTLDRLEKNKFAVLDQVRELTSENKVPVTLSIGVGAGGDSFLELGEMAQSGLDIALGRGGDQAAVKRGSEKIAFYGGKTNAVEKRTRVRVRVISHALQNIIQSSDRIFIMGHQNPDMDSVGSSIGILKMVQAVGKEGYLVLNDRERAPGISRLMEALKQDEKLYEHFIFPQKALELKTDQSLLIVVDAHKPSLLIEPKLSDHLSKRVVIDHHRRGEEMVPDPLLTYIEPYASSTSELVSELLEYQGNEVRLSKLEATAMLAGIVVDTKNFAVHTGSRTFDAASYLRRNGADSAFVQKLLTEDKDQFVKRAHIVGNADIYRDTFAIAVADPNEQYGKVLLAQAADTLLALKDITASFVLSERPDERITINARSWGDINVQMMMEKMDGGGHLTHAATQLEETSMEEALQWLKEVIDETLEGGTES